MEEVTPCLSVHPYQIILCTGSFGFKIHEGVERVLYGGKPVFYTIKGSIIPRKSPKQKSAPVLWSVTVKSNKIEHADKTITIIASLLSRRVRSSGSLIIAGAKNYNEIAAIYNPLLPLK